MLNWISLRRFALSVFFQKGRQEKGEEWFCGWGLCACVCLWWGFPFIFPAWILQKVITYYNGLSALFACHIFPSGLWSVPHSVQTLKKRKWPQTNNPLYRCNKPAFVSDSKMCWEYTTGISLPTHDKQSRTTRPLEVRILLSYDCHVCVCCTSAFRMEASW